jgi:threonyl-tRNA synthetase
VWLAPVQVVGIPVSEQYEDFLGGVVGELRSAGVRAELDASDDRMQKKIRNHTKAKTPLQLIVGEEDQANGAVSFRFRDGTQENGVPAADAVRRIRAAIAAKLQVNTASDLPA